MNKLLIFGGTSEEHALLEALAPLELEITLCVAGTYGRFMAPTNDPCLTVREGRLDSQAMASLIREEGFFCVVDATHPYAVEVTRNITLAAEAADIPNLRLLRNKSEAGDALVVDSLAEAVRLLNTLDGSVLLTTGSKDLAAFTAVRDYKSRLYPRVLPSVESIGACLSNGYPANHIIAMHGPFSKELNIALMRQYKIQVMVTKDGGVHGGFPEKHAAAHELNAPLIVIRRPEEGGLTLNETVAQISKLLEGEK